MTATSLRIVEATLDDLVAMRRFINETVAELGVSDDAAGELLLAVNEALTNILLHGYDGRPGEIEILVEPSGADVVVRLLDRARLYDPTLVASPDVTLPLEQRAPGGLGVHMMRELTDDLRYREAPGGGNELIMAKRGVVPAPAGDATAHALSAGLHRPRSLVTLLPEELARMEAIATCRDVVPGEVIMKENEPGRRMFVLMDGELQVTLQGRPIDYITPGAVFGEMAMVEESTRSATVTAITPARLLPIDRQQFQELIRQSPELGLRVMGIMSQRMRRLLEEEVRRQRMEEELAIGRRIQLTMLPAACPQIPGWQFAAAYRAAREVGGDLYDFVISPQDPDILHIIIGDVTGKGVPAALFMAVGRTLLRMEALDDRKPADALQHVNRFIVNDVNSPLFMSAFMVSLNAATGDLVYANAGHNPPYWLQSGAGTFQTLEGPGIVLGAFEITRSEDRACSIAAGDFLILFTDGVTEARAADDSFLEESGLEAILTSRPWSGADELLSGIVDALDRFSEGAEQADDYTVIVAYRKPD